MLTNVGSKSKYKYLNKEQIPCKSIQAQNKVLLLRYFPPPLVGLAVGYEAGGRNPNLKDAWQPSDLFFPGQVSPGEWGAPPTRLKVPGMWTAKE